MATYLRIATLPSFPPSSPPVIPTRLAGALPRALCTLPHSDAHTHPVPVRPSVCRRRRRSTPISRRPAPVCRLPSPRNGQPRPSHGAAAQPSEETGRAAVHLGTPQTVLRASGESGKRVARCARGSASGDDVDDVDVERRGLKTSMREGEERGVEPRRREEGRGAKEGCEGETFSSAVSKRVYAHPVPSTTPSLGLDVAEAPGASQRTWS
ncbi:hypothetical protein EYR40_004745 [Pleurotus pulmonarius]|nr:hypothetical protein EYR40_004745 [Pleurotus pulmonarius]